MKKSIAMKWVKALRSGKYKQCYGSLKRNGGYCCLGVLCDISKQGEWASVPEEKHSIYIKTRRTMKNGSGWLPSFMIKWGGLQSCCGYLEDGTSLSDYNDQTRYSFKKIAKIIEKHWKEL